MIKQTVSLGCVVLLMHKMTTPLYLDIVLVIQGLSVDVHGLADGLKGLVEAGLAKAAGQCKTAQC